VLARVGDELEAREEPLLDRGGGGEERADRFEDEVGELFGEELAREVVEWLARLVGETLELGIDLLDRADRSDT
jgi:hypothetical protein